MTTKQTLELLLDKFVAANSVPITHRGLGELVEVVEQAGSDLVQADGRTLSAWCNEVGLQLEIINATVHDRREAPSRYPDPWDGAPEEPWFLQRDRFASQKLIADAAAAIGQVLSFQPELTAALRTLTDRRPPELRPADINYVTALVDLGEPGALIDATAVAIDVATFSDDPQTCIDARAILEVIPSELLNHHFEPPFANRVTWLVDPRKD